MTRKASVCCAMAVWATCKSPTTSSRSIISFARCSTRDCEDTLLPLLASQRHKHDRRHGVSRDATYSPLFHEQQCLLRLPITHRNHQAATRLELLDQRRRDGIGGSNHDNGIIRRVLGPAQIAVPLPH